MHSAGWVIAVVLFWSPQAVDFSKILARADQLLEESKAARLKTRGRKLLKPHAALWTPPLRAGASTADFRRGFVEHVALPLKAFLDHGILIFFADESPAELHDMSVRHTAAVAEELYLSVLTRRPDAEERKEVAAFLAPRSHDRAAALQGLAWALLASTEFCVNH